MSIVTVEQLSHMYGDKNVFHNISFRLVRGEHAGLVGGNGAGKSTLLRILSGELLPDRGTVEWLPGIRAGYLQQHIDLQAGTSIIEYLRTAYAELYAMEARMNQLAARMAEGGGDLDSLLTRYGGLQQRLEHSGFYLVDAKIEEVAAGLGILALGPDRDVSELSGGQRTKLLLGKLLLEQPDVLLLDEPTNYLDDVHVEWLIGYLTRYEQAFLVVSHDERFLSAITTTIYHLEHQSIRRYSGNYEQFKRSYALNKEQLQAAYARQQREIERLEAFIQKNRIRKAKQAKSREKMLERIERIDRPPSGPQPRFAFRVHADPAGTVIEARQLQIGYREPLFAPVDLAVKRGEKIAIVGSNGIGKSTMLKTLLGLIPALGGTVQFGDRVAAAYFAQEEQPPEHSPLEHLSALRPDMTLKDFRRLLAQSGLTEKHIRKPIRLLSGGEQAKVRLCALMLTDSNVLVLDEPTSHLDVRAKEAFHDALRKYAGTILLVSHEPDFYRNWVSQVWNVQEWSKR
ncbi:ABC transporter ATP-binding protein [Paenibacillus dendritiformis]|nr:ABC-F family ATP-binding cassette domain-containing protein [Paenibacillus dendritiformis]GIO74750.1 ABC transporter ATP-binding protein [Paenibacillus dendritiformis]